MIIWSIKKFNIFAAFIDPPPSPASCGIFFLILIWNFLFFNIPSCSSILSSFSTVLFLFMFLENFPKKEKLIITETEIINKINLRNEAREKKVGGEIICNIS